MRAQTPQQPAIAGEERERTGEVSEQRDREPEAGEGSRAHHPLARGDGRKQQREEAAEKGESQTFDEPCDR